MESSSEQARNEVMLAGRDMRYMARRARCSGREKGGRGGGRRQCLF